MIIGSNTNAIANVVERQSSFTVHRKVDSRKAQSVVESLTEQIKRLPQSVLRILTWDRGNEMSAHKKFTMATDMEVYFCDPSSPWQRSAGPSFQTSKEQHGINPMFCKQKFQ